MKIKDEERVDDEIGDIVEIGWQNGSHAGRIVDLTNNVLKLKMLRGWWFEGGEEAELVSTDGQCYRGGSLRYDRW